VKTSTEEKQMQAESTIQMPKSDVQTQIPDRDHQLVQLMPKDQMKQPQRKAVAPFMEGILEADKQVQVDPFIHPQTLNVNEPIPLSRPHILIQVVSSNYPQAGPVCSTLSSYDETVPGALGVQTPMKHDNSLQRPHLTHKHVLFKDQAEATDIQDPANQVSVAGTSDDILESVPSHVAVEQLLQEAEHTGKMVTLDNKVSHEALFRRREHLVKESSVKYEKCDINCKELMKRSGKEDNEQLNRILLRKFTVTSGQPVMSVPTPQINQPANQIKDIIRSELATDYKRLNSRAPVVVEENSASESLLQAQVSVYCKVVEIVDEKHCSDFQIHFEPNKALDQHASACSVLPG
jgi:hypothetical protein